MSWQDAPITQQGTPSVTPAWQRAPVMPASTAAPKTSKPTIPDQETPGGGFLDAGLRSIVNSVPNAANSVNDLINRVLPGTGLPTNAPTMQPTAGETSAVQGVASSAPVQAIMDRVGPVLDAIVHGSQEQDTALQQAHPMLHAALHNLSAVASDALQAAPVVAGGANALGAAIPAPTAASPGEAIGFRSAATHPIAAGVAGGSGTDALTLHNQQIGNVLANAESGVPHNTPLGYDTLDTARAAPNAVYSRVAQSLPTGQLDATAQAEIGSAGQPAGGRITAGSPQAQVQIDALKQQLLNPQRVFTGDQQVNELRGLRQEGYNNIASDDVSNQQLGSAQIDMARAIEGHIGRNLPPNGTVDLGQFQDARTALAKNYAVQGALKGSNIDMQAVARMQRADPDLLTGGLQTIADFANSHPTVTGLANRIEVAPSFGNDIGKAMGGNLESVLSPSFWSRVAGGQAGARGILTGNTGQAVSQAQGAFPGRLGDAFSSLPPGELDLRPPPGQVGNAPIQRTLPVGPGSGQVPMTGGGLTASPPGGAPPGAAAPTSDIPLADLLSHGVEQSPAPGLSAGPMGSPEPQGIPFQRNAAHEAGNLETAPGPIPKATTGLQSPAAWIENFLNGDHAGVMSQGVPEGIVQRANNASGESPASLEAISRGTRPLAIIDPDGNEQPLLRDVTQIDQAPPKGSMIIDRSTGEIVNRGGLNAAQAMGLRNRWATMGRTLGDHFTVGP